MKFLITHPNTKNVLGEVITRLGLIEVRGDSIDQLFYVRAGLKQIIDSIQEVPDDEKTDTSIGKGE